MPKKYRKSFIDANGQRHFTKRYNTEPEAIKALGKLEEQVSQGIIIHESKMLFKDWADVYLETYRQPSCGKERYEDLVAQNRKWISGTIGKLQLCNVKKAHCQNVLNNMAVNKMSYSRILKIRQLLFAILEEATNSDLINKNPARGLVMPNAPKGERRALNDLEKKVFERLYQTHPHGLWIWLMYKTGMRAGETERLYGRHIDLEKKLLFIDGTKSKKATRYFPLTNEMIEVLKPFADEPFLPVFRQKDGKSPITKNTRRRWWESIKLHYNKINGEPLSSEIVPHCFRHTCATELKSKGISLSIIGDLLGHEETGTTSIYAHSSNESLEYARSILDKADVPNDVPKLK